MNPNAAWLHMLPGRKVLLIKSYFNWLTITQLYQAAALPYGELPDFIRLEVQLLTIGRM